MGKPTGFMDYKRAVSPDTPPLERIKSFEPFHGAVSETERRRQAGRCMDCGVPFCQAGIVFEGERLGCPLHNLIPEWNDMLWRGVPAQALSRLLKTNCFPEFTGRVCPALCERACTCGMLGESVTVRDNELGIIEYAFENGLMEPKAPSVRSGRSIAVVGSGPAGLSAAYWLNRRGHSVTVYERDAFPGGLLTYGIPNMKLPKSIVARRIALMRAEGVAFETGVDVGRSLGFDALRSGHDCVIYCCGAQKPRELGFEGKADGVCYAADYLKDAARAILGEPGTGLTAAGKSVIVVGAGDSASDCIAAALRQGCTSVTQLIRRPASDYTGVPEDYAHEEARAVFGRDVRRFGTAVRAVIAGEEGRLSAVAAVSSESEEQLPAEMLIIASGFSGPEDYVSGLAETDGVFLAGDMARGASLVVLAIADGKRAAARADEYLMGYTSIE